MRKMKCHVCKDSKRHLILLGEHEVCGFCFANLYFDEKELPTTIINNLQTVIVLSHRDSMDFMQGKIMCWFLKHGYTISQCARQLGITRATVYSKLREHNLIKLGEDGKFALNPNTADLLASGHCQFVKVNNSVTGRSAGRSYDLQELQPD